MARSEEEEVVQLDLIFWMAYSEDDRLMCGIRQLPNTPGEVGMMLADALRHFANAYEQNGHDRNRAVLEMYNLFMAEMNCPTDTPTATHIRPDQVRFNDSSEEEDEGEE